MKLYSDRDCWFEDSCPSGLQAGNVTGEVKVTRHLVDKEGGVGEGWGGLNETSNQQGKG